MSQKSVLIACSILVVLLVVIAQSTEAKRVGCASFGHSCYGGHGKRSDMQFPPQEVDPVEGQQTILRVLQRRFPPVEMPTNEITDNEKEIMKPLILNMLRDLIDETSRKIKEIEVNSA